MKLELIHLKTCVLQSVNYEELAEA